MNTTPDDRETANRLKERTAHLSVISNAGLVFMKFGVGFAIGSVSIISEAIHSSMDLLAAVIAYFSVKKSAEPPDAGHSFGHGKFEDVSGLIEALLIVAAAVIIIAEAVLRLLGRQEQEFSPEPALIWYCGDGHIGARQLVRLLASHESGKRDRVHRP